MRISKKEVQNLIKEARKAIKNAYCPISEFPVGAAILTEKGDIYSGCNVESVISGLGVCAERAAIDHAVAHGEFCFKAIAIFSKFKKPLKPCGACLQYINEFAQVAGHDILIFMVGNKGKVEKSSVYKMLPGSFGPEDLGLNLDKYRKKHKFLSSNFSPIYGNRENGKRRKRRKGKGYKVNFL